MRRDPNKLYKTAAGLEKDVGWSKDIIEKQVEDKTIGRSVDIEDKQKVEIEIDIQDENSKTNKKMEEKAFYHADPKEAYKLKYPMSYTNQEFRDFKERLAKHLIECGISTDDALKNPDVMNMITNYAKEHFIDKKDQNIIDRVTYKFVHSTIQVLGAQKTYPIVFRYRGHYITHAIYFTIETHMDGTKNLKVMEEPVKTNKVSIWTP